VLAWSLRARWKVSCSIRNGGRGLVVAQRRLTARAGHAQVAASGSRYHLAGGLLGAGRPGIGGSAG
jgi:hypothetical protein